MPRTGQPLLTMQGITVRYGALLANDNVDFSVQPGEIRALLGENGAGKSTLMKVLAGLVQPTAGHITLRSRPVTLSSPVQAMQWGIGMVHQHFMLVPTLTVTQNICVGLRSAGYPFPHLRRVAGELRSLSARYGLQIDPEQKVAALSVGAQQRVEIVKALYRGAELLILDEPTAVLTPQESERLFAVVRALAAQGKAVIFISHKLNEVMAVSHQVTVLRQGRVVGDLPTTATSSAELARLMVGRAVTLPRVDSRPPALAAPVLAVQGLRYTDIRRLEALQGIDLTVRRGEIHGIAGVDGNGQEELAYVLAGLVSPAAGTIILDGIDVTTASPARRIAAGLAHIPGDRQRVGLVLDLSLADNAVLPISGRPPYSRRGIRNDGAIRRLAKQLIAAYTIHCRDEQQPAGALSGGNQQKLVLARELFRAPRLIVANQPTRGLDVGAIETVYTVLLEQRRQGRGILLISTELDEIMALSDRVSVLYEGRILATLPRDEANREHSGPVNGGPNSMTMPLTPTPPVLTPTPARRRPFSGAWITHLVAIALALLVGAGLMALIGVNPLAAYRALLDGAFGNRNSMAETLVRTVPLALAGIGVAFAFQAGVFNIGAEGQLFIGATAATWIGLQFATLPRWPLLLLMLLTAMLAGGIWAAIAGWLKIWRGASELINTIMLNYIAIFLVAYLLHGPLQEPGSPLGQTARLSAAAILPVILPRTRLHAGLIIALIAALVAYFLLWRTTWGFHIRVAGKNALAARERGHQCAWGHLLGLSAQRRPGRSCRFL